MIVQRNRIEWNIHHNSTYGNRQSEMRIDRARWMTMKKERQEVATHRNRHETKEKTKKKKISPSWKETRLDAG